MSTALKTGLNHKTNRSYLQNPHVVAPESRNCSRVPDQKAVPTLCSAVIRLSCLPKSADTTFLVISLARYMHEIFLIIFDVMSQQQGTERIRPLTSAILVYYSPYYSPYDVISDVIGNPHYSASYPYVIVNLRGARVGARVTARGLGLHASSPKPNVSACVTRPFHDVCLRHH